MPPWLQEYERALASAGGTVTPELQRAIERMDGLQAWEIDSEVRLRGRTRAAWLGGGAGTPAKGDPLLHRPLGAP
jgi:hypothetical protein